MLYLGELTEDESVRNEEINGHLCQILGHDPDGTISVSVGRANVPLLTTEFKRLLGEGDCDPCIQAGLSMQHRWKMSDVGSFYKSTHVFWLIF